MSVFNACEYIQINKNECLVICVHIRLLSMSVLKTVRMKKMRV